MFVEIIYWLLVVTFFHFAIRYLITYVRLDFRAKVSRRKKMILVLVALLLYILVDFLHFSSSSLLLIITAYLYFFFAQLCEGLGKKGIYYHRIYLVLPILAPWDRVKYLHFDEERSVLMSFHAEGELIEEELAFHKNKNKEILHYLQRKEGEENVGL